MLRALTRVRKRPSKYLNVKMGIYDGTKWERQRNNNVRDEMRDGRLSVEQLDYAIQCGKEARARKTW